MSFEKSSKKKELIFSCSKCIQQIEYILNIVNQMCIGFITIYMTWFSMRNKLSGTSLHAWLVTIGYVFLMSEAIMCHYENNVLTYSFRRKTKTTIHWVLQVLGGGCGVAGALLKLLEHNFQLASLHGKIGFAAFILCLVSMVSGLMALYSVSMRRVLRPLLNKTFHNSIGIATFVLALLAEFYGFEKKLVTHNVPLDFEVLLKCITLIALILTCIGPFKALYNKLFQYN